MTVFLTSTDWSQILPEHVESLTTEPYKFEPSLFEILQEN